MQPEGSAPQGTNNKLNLALDLRWVVIALLLVIVALVALWRPWQTKATSDNRTVSVTGQATIKATPDEFVFSPSYQFKNADKDAALKALTAKSDEVTAGLKKLGVADTAIKSNSNGYDRDMYYYDTKTNDGYTYTLSLAVTVTDQKLVQKVQDYLVTTAPTGSVSPYANFSDAKRKQLEAQARDEATKEARAKADQSAKNLGFRVGAVKSVDDGGFGGGVVYPMMSGNAAVAEDKASSSLQVQPGENDLNYSVTVVYYVK